jgi:hypothetical protein
MNCCMDVIGLCDSFMRPVVIDDVTWDYKFLSMSVLNIKIAGYKMKGLILATAVILIAFYMLLL